jgi:hypothetical protein
MIIPVLEEVRFGCEIWGTHQSDDGPYCLMECDPA